MFPIGDENRGIRSRPYVTYALIAINVVIFLYQITLDQSALTDFILKWGTIPREISDGTDLFTLGTCMFLHGGWLHIAGNMLFLWVFGDNIEDTMGHVKFLVFYLLCGLAASGLQVIVNPDSETPMIGASGAISGVLAAYLVLYPKGKIRTMILAGIPIMVLIPAWGMIGYWIVIQFINGIASLGVNTAETGGGVAYFAHIGGFVAGAALVWIFRDREIQQRHLDNRSGNRAFQRTRLISK
jgi:membrane associated rhomboid family serine protease